MILPARGHPRAEARDRIQKTTWGVQPPSRVEDTVLKADEGMTFYGKSAIYGFKASAPYILRPGSALSFEERQGEPSLGFDTPLPIATRDSATIADLAALARWCADTPSDPAIASECRYFAYGSPQGASDLVDGTCSRRPGGFLPGAQQPPAAQRRRADRHGLAKAVPRSSGAPESGLIAALLSRLITTLCRLSPERRLVNKDSATYLPVVASPPASQSARNSGHALLLDRIIIDELRVLVPAWPRLSARNAVIVRTTSRSALDRWVDTSTRQPALDNRFDVRAVSLLDSAKMLSPALGARCSKSTTVATRRSSNFCNRMPTRQLT